MGVLLGHGFVSLLVLLDSAPAGSAPTLVLHQSHYAHTANRHLRAKGERHDVSTGAAAVGKKAHLRTEG